MRGWAPKAGFSPWLLPLVALGFPVGAAAAADDAPKLPRAVVPRMIVDLGVVPVGPEATASFSIHNKGEGPLEILEVETSCSCTVADFDPTVEPGSVGTVRASLVTTELSGPVTKGIVVRTNDPDQETIVLSLKAIVKGSVSLLPQPVIFMRKRAGEAPVGRLLIRKDDKEPDALEVGGVTVSDPRLVATAFELDKARPRGGGLPSAAAGDWVLEIRFRDGRTVFGGLKGDVRFLTGLASQPEVTVDVESNLRAPVTLSTERLVLDRTPDGARGTAFVSVRKGLDAGSLRVTADPPDLDVELEPSTERLFKLQVSWAGEALRGATVRLSIGDESVVLPVALSGP